MALRQALRLLREHSRQLVLQLRRCLNSFEQQQVSTLQRLRESVSRWALLQESALLRRLLRVSVLSRPFQRLR